MHGRWNDIRCRSHRILAREAEDEPGKREPLVAKDLIKLNFARNADAATDDDQGDLIDPVSYKVFTDNTHIVAIRHGTYANVFAWDTVERMNIKAKMWRDLVDDTEFGRSDIITLQDPQHAEGRDLSRFKYLKDGEGALLTPEQKEGREGGNVNINALGRIGDKVLRAKEAVRRAREEREAGGDINRSGAGSKALAKVGGGSASAAARPRIQEKKQAYNAAAYTTGKAAASFTSTGLTPETSGERALLTDEEYMLKPRRVKHRGYARIETNLGDLNIELQTEFAPRAVWNFVRLAQQGYYRGVTFHRNISNFMIQGGDPTGTGKGGTSVWGKNFVDEFDGPLTHDARGVISMANKGKDTNSSQFFITYKATPHLNRKHTIFGKVVGGMDVLKKMEEVPTDGSNRPLNKIVMKEVVVYVDPFEEFQKERGEAEQVAAAKALRKAQGGNEDDKTTWTGKRLRADDSGRTIVASAGVGKYLKDAMKQAKEQVPGDVDAWEEQPVKKKFKLAGFGNFDGW